MKTSLPLISVCTTKYGPYSYDLKVTFYYACAKSVVALKRSADGKPAYSRTRILTDSARKINRKEVLANYNKTRINIGNQHDCLMELKVALRVQTQWKCKHQCH